MGIGALLWSLLYLRDATSPYLYFLYVLPAPFLVPAALTLFGIGFTMKVVLIAFAALWPTLLNTLDGMRGVDEVKLDTSRVLGVSPLGSVFRVVLPAAAPQIVAGLRNSLQVAIILMVVSEWEASTDGIGYYIVNAQRVLRLRGHVVGDHRPRDHRHGREPAVRGRGEPRPALALRRPRRGGNPLKAVVESVGRCDDGQ
jgi:ABC-type nitrate/sulfonate/bicarbonate transport system permease component